MDANLQYKFPWPCVSYSRLLEILTAIHMSVTDHDSPIPPGIKAQGNEVLHFCWDNFDLNEETGHGVYNN